LAQKGRHLKKGALKYVFLIYPLFRKLLLPK
jgi:hypothetical protein